MTITSITRVNTDSAGRQSTGDEFQFSHAVSANGRYVAFGTNASSLVAGDTNGTIDVFIKDLQTGATTRVSTDSAGGEANSYSYVDDLSADGRYVLFTSVASNLVTGDTNDEQDVFVKDLQTGVTTRVNTNNAGVQGDALSSGGDLSADGRYVTFNSSATNVLPPYQQLNFTTQVYVKDLQTGEIERVSTNSAGVKGTLGSSARESSLSADNRYVAFASRASNLVPGDTNFAHDVFVKDRQTGVTTRVSTDSAGGQSNAPSDGGSISADGRYVVFRSSATNLVAGDTNGKYDIFLKDLQTGETTRVSTDSAGRQANSDSEQARISPDGRYVVFQSYAWNLVPGDTNRKYDIFVKDLQTGVTTLVSTDIAGGQGNGDSLHPQLSADGQSVVFLSYASNLVAGDTNGTPDVFIVRLPQGSLPTLSSNADTWTGTAGPDTIDALAGNDSLNGAGGNDSLIGGDGKDTLDGGAGADTLTGGRGADTYFVDAGDAIGEFGGTDVNRVYSTASWTLGENLQHLYLRGQAAIDGTGNDGSNVLGGNGSANRLDGLGGSDRLWGQGGNDTLLGGSGHDSLFGGAGSDRLRGGSGADLFGFTGAEVTDGTADLDVIVDYSRAAGDVVDLVDPAGFTVISAPGSTLRIRLAGSADVIEFTGITDIADVLFV